MAVYTEVGFAEADALCQRLGLGVLTDLQGIRSGIENTNYYASTVRGQWVLTLFERLPADQLPYYLKLMQHLAARGIPVPAPQPATDGCLVHRVAGKPASVVTRLPGSHRLRPDADQAAQVGRMLARMHVRRLISLCSSRTCAAWPGGRKRCPWYCRTWRPNRPRCFAKNWPSSSTWPAHRRAWRCRAGPSTPICSATT